MEVKPAGCPRDPRGGVGGGGEGLRVGKLIRLLFECVCVSVCEPRKIEREPNKFKRALHQRCLSPADAPATSCRGG